MAPTPGDCAIAKPIQPTSDQQPTTGFHAELQTMGHAQLSVPASAPSEKCTSTLPNLQIDGSETAASTVSDATKSAQQIDSGKASHPTYDNSYYPSGKSPVSLRRMKPLTLIHDHQSMSKIRI